MPNDRDFKGIWIPKEIWLDDNLSHTERFLLVEIDSLDNQDGCYASNEYLANFLRTSEKTISQSISNLKTMGYITQESFDGRKRILRSCINIITRQGTPKGVGCINKKVKHNNTSNNTSKLSTNNKINTTGSINEDKPPVDNIENELFTKGLSDAEIKKRLAGTSEEGKTKPKTPSIDNLINKFSENIKIRKLLKEFCTHYVYTTKHYLSKAQFTRMLDNLNTIAKDDNEIIEIINITIQRGWKSFFKPEAEKKNKASYIQKKSYKLSKADLELSGETY
jgi:hypothetical protein